MRRICTHPALPHLVSPAIYAAPRAMACVSPASIAASNDILEQKAKWSQRHDIMCGPTQNYVSPEG